MSTISDQRVLVELDALLAKVYRAAEAFMRPEALLAIVADPSAQMGFAMLLGHLRLFDALRADGVLQIDPRVAQAAVTSLRTFESELERLTSMVEAETGGPTVTGAEA